MEEIFDEVKYFKNKTFVACFRTSKSAHDRLHYLEDGVDNPKAFFEWLLSARVDVEKQSGENATITYSNIL